MISKCINMGTAEVMHFDGENSMIPFNVQTLEGLPEVFIETAKSMLKGMSSTGTAYFTAHGKTLKSGGTLRRGGPHTDGNYEPNTMTFGGGGWKVGENGPAVSSEEHKRQYLSEKGGIILLTNYQSAVGYCGEFNDIPHVGGDCSHIDLPESFPLKAFNVYYGNNHFIHESLPVNADVHRVMYRITMPESHEFKH